MSQKGNKLCACGHPQSWPIPHEHDQTDREKAIIEYFRNSHDALVERIDALEELLVCYRIGRRPTEKLHKKLDKTKAALKKAE